MKNADTMDVQLRNLVEQKVKDSLVSELLNNMTLSKGLKLLRDECEKQADTIIANADGEVKKNLDQLREQVMKEAVQQREAMAAAEVIDGGVTD